MQVLNIFGDGQNCYNYTFKWLYQLYKSKYEICFFRKIITVILFLLYQVFSSLLSHLHFSVYFSFSFMEQLFKNHPVSDALRWSVCVPVSELSLKSHDFKYSMFFNQTFYFSEIAFVKVIKIGVSWMDERTHPLTDLREHVEKLEQTVLRLQTRKRGWGGRKMNTRECFHNTLKGTEVLRIAVNSS